MSQKQADQTGREKAETLKRSVNCVLSDNVCSGESSESDSEAEDESESDSNSGRVRCAACGFAFLPDKARTKFCDHACYSDWRSARTAFVDRFWSKVNKTSSCWLWTGAVRGNGYGFIAQRRVNGRQVRTMAHRMAWEMAHGPIPSGLVACHTCDTPACVNPAHLFLGTPKDNIADALRKGRPIGRPRKALQGVGQEPRDARQFSQPVQALACDVVVHERQSAIAQQASSTPLKGARTW